MLSSLFALVMTRQVSQAEPFGDVCFSKATTSDEDMFRSMRSLQSLLLDRLANRDTTVHHHPGKVRHVDGSSLVEPAEEPPLPNTLSPENIYTLVIDTNVYVRFLLL